MWLSAATALEIADGEVCFVGTGVPSAAAIAAKMTHAPGAMLVYESGAIDTLPSSIPLSTASPAIVTSAAMIGTCLDAFALLQCGNFDLGILSGAQVDRFGNLNSTVIGDYRRPRLRLTGSGGAHDIAALADEVIIMMPHEPRRFVRDVDFVTTPGRFVAGNSRLRRSSRGKGPRCVITPRARFSLESGELTLEAVFHGFTEDDALEGITWSIPRAGTVRRLPPFLPPLLAATSKIISTATHLGL